MIGKVTLKTVPTYMGVDPGGSGGVAVICGKEITIKSMPDTEQDVWNWIRGFQTVGLFATIEKVGGFIGKNQPGSAMFKFGQSYGSLRMALIAASIPFEEVVPQTWQKGLSIPKKTDKESKTQWKNRLKAKAQQLFPKEKITLATADAILIAEYCRRKREGKL